MKIRKVCALEKELEEIDNNRDRDGTADKDIKEKKAEIRAKITNIRSQRTAIIIPISLAISIISLIISIIV